ncbi:hypothetical protein BDR06DRAFT_969186 [Suillus hirtellus]|nr:hypothetical protein BDR06DRAFT_969186 [Suillus hirtellus]
MCDSGDHRPDPPPETCSNQPRSQVKQAVRKFAKGVTKKLSKRFKCSRKRTPAIQNVELQDASSNQNIRVNQGTSGEPASKLDIPSGVEEGVDSKSVDAELQGAHEASEHIQTLGGPAQSVTSAANNAQAGLTAADDFQTNYLQPLKIFDTVIEKIANVWAALLSW